MGLSELFDDIADPRAANTVHKLGDLIVIMIAAVMCGRRSASDIALFAELRREALAPILRYDRAPSHDTISRLLRLLDPTAFARALPRFATAFAAALARLEGRDFAHVAIDGKALKRACEADERFTPPMALAAFASELGLVLGVMPGDGAAGVDEGKLAVELVELLDLTGKIVTADALHCQRPMARAIHEGGADYVLGLKRNRAAWHDATVRAFATGAARTAATDETSHGRRERREAAVLAAKEALAPGHTAFGRIVSQRGDAAPKTRYFLLSKHVAPEDLLTLTRRHWHIETALHWTLDVHFGEDHNRARRDNSPANIATLNRFARNLLQMADKPNVPISHRITKCTFDDHYLRKALGHMR